MPSASASFALACAAVALGAISPGPSFLHTLQANLRAPGHAVPVALGMGAGAATFATLALAGLATLLTAVPTLHAALRAAGAAYLLTLAWASWQGARIPLGLPAAACAPASRRAFLLAAATQLSNPKTAIVYGSIFAATLPAAPTLSFAALLVAAVLAIETTWYLAVGLACRTAGPQRAYAAAKGAIDRTAGAMFTALGLDLAFRRSSPQ